MQQPAPNPFVTKILWVALVVSQAIYLGIPSPRAGEGTPQAFAAVLALVATTQAVGVLLFFRIAGVRRIQSGKLDPTTAAGMGQLFTVLILSWVLTEAIAIYGLVLRFLGGPLWQTGLFALAAFALMVVTQPWQSGLEPPVSSAERGRDPSPIA